MANVDSGNTIFVDSTASSLGADGITLQAIVFAGVGGVGRITLQDSVTLDTKLDVLVPQNDTRRIVFQDTAPIRFANGIKVVTATNIVATLVVKKPR